MRLEDIKAMNLRTYEPVQIRYLDEREYHSEERLGWFLRLVELPNVTTEIPGESKECYLVDPPFVEIAHKIDGNYQPRDVFRYIPGKINRLIRLYLRKYE